jgi:acetyl esterase/lipase
MRRGLCVFVLVALAACGGGGDTASCPDVGCSVEETLDVAYVEGDTPLSVKPVFDIYAPAEGGPWPVVVIAPWGDLGKESARGWATAMAAEGTVVFATDFLVGAPQTPLEHVNCAARYARDVADEYGGDPSHVTLLGYADGAYFGMPVSLGVDALPPMCLASDDAAIPDAFVGYEGYYGVGDPKAEQEARGRAPDAGTLVGQNPDLVVRLIHGDLEDLLSDAPVAVSEDFAEILDEAGYDVEFILVEGAAHSGAGTEDSPAFDVIVDTTLEVAGG